MEAAAFATAIKQEVSEIFGPVSVNDGLSEQPILGVERRLGFRLPELLRQFYLALGNHKKATDGMNHILPPRHLLIREQALVFCEEHQRAYFWGIKLEQLSDDDPAVFQGSLEDKGWYPDSAHLSCFLGNTMCWQAVNSLRAGGQGTITDSDLARLVARYKRPCGEDPVADKKVRALFGTGIGLCYFPSSHELFAAAHTDAQLREFERQFKITLAWF